MSDKDNTQLVTTSTGHSDESLRETGERIPLVLPWNDNHYWVKPYNYEVTYYPSERRLKFKYTGININATVDDNHYVHVSASGIYTDYPGTKFYVRTMVNRWISAKLIPGL